MSDGSDGENNSAGLESHQLTNK